MKIIQRTERVMSHSSETCTVYEHPYEEGDTFNTADIVLRGRYPEDGRFWVRNTAVDALVNVAKGRGEVQRPGQPPEPISADASITIEQGELYAFDGHMTLTYTATPPWTPDQAEYIEL